MTKRSKDEVEEALKELQGHEQKVEDKLNELTHLALGTFKDMKTGEWMIAKIRYNPESGRVGSVEKVEGGNKDIAVEKFKITAVREGVV